MRVQEELQGAGDLFCSAACETLYAVRAGGGGLRRALYRLERGVCQQCGSNCHALVERLRCRALLGIDQLQHISCWLFHADSPHACSTCLGCGSRL